MSGLFASRMPKPEAMPLDRFRAAVTGPEIEDLLDYWLSRRGTAVMPKRRDIDPLDMPRLLLPYLYLLTVEEDGGFRFRLAGTRLVEVFRNDITGKRLEDVLEGEDLSNAKRSYSRIVDVASPWYSRVNYRVDDNDGEILYQRLTLPLGEEGRVDRLLGGLTIHRDSRIYEDFYEAHGRRGITTTARLEAVLS